MRATEIIPVEEFGEAALLLDAVDRRLRRLRFSGQVDKLRLTGPERRETWV
jgi:hypothetical protein